MCPGPDSAAAPDGAAPDGPGRAGPAAAIPVPVPSMRTQMRP
jgi:hypothetical protein